MLVAVAEVTGEKEAGREIRGRVTNGELVEISGSGSRAIAAPEAQRWSRRKVVSGRESEVLGSVNLLEPSLRSGGVIDGENLLERDVVAVGTVTVGSKGNRGGDLSSDARLRTRKSEISQKVAELQEQTSAPQ